MLKIRLISTFVVMTVLTACETIPYNPMVAKTVAEYGVDADRHIVAVGTAWQRCYDAYDADKVRSDTVLRISQDVGYALYSVADIDDINLTQREALRLGLIKLAGDARLDALRNISPPFRDYLKSWLDDKDLEPLLRKIADTLSSPRRNDQSEQEWRAGLADAVIAFMSAAEADRRNCIGAAFASFEDKFYDDWSSKLFAVQQQAKADDALGLCSRVAKKVSGYASDLTDLIPEEKSFKEALSGLSFRNGADCSLATIGGVAIQHELLRQAHKDQIVIARDYGKLWRETIGQSVRIATTVENFKKSAAAEADQLF
jgi:hypothetical protein